MRENIDKIGNFLVICQKFPYHAFILAIANVAPASFVNILFVNFIHNANLSIFSLGTHQDKCASPQ